MVKRSAALLLGAALASFHCVSTLAAEAAKEGNAEFTDPLYKQKKVYNVRDCHSLVNGRANLTLCALEFRSVSRLLWSDTSYL